MSRQLRIRPLRADDGARIAAACLRDPAFAPPPDLADCVGALGARLEPITLRSAFGAVAEDGDILLAAVVAAETASPWRDTWREGVVHVAFGPEPMLAALVQRTVDLARDRALVILRTLLLPEQDRLVRLHARWELSHFTVRKRIADRPTIQTDSIRIRRALRCDRPFVVDWMTRGLEEGLTAVERRLVEATDLTRAVNTYLAHLDAKGTGYVAVAEGCADRLGVSITDMSAHCELLRMSHARVHDVYVPEHAREAGLGRRLYADLEAVAFDIGVRDLTATVAAPSAAEVGRLLDKVRPQGWTPLHVCRCVGLAPDRIGSDREPERR